MSQLGVVFPDGSGIQGLVYKLVGAIYNGGAVSYGIAIILFTLVLRLIFLPLDFGNRYFTKKNAAEMAKMKPEIDQAKAQHGGDFRAFSIAQQQIKRKHGYSGLGFGIFMAINLVVTLVVFINVFYGLRSISDYNINAQFVELQKVYDNFEERRQAGGDREGLNFYDLGEEPTDEDLQFRAEFIDAIQDKYEETRVTFLWVHNIWRPDTWSSKTLDWNQFNSALSGMQGGVILNLSSEELAALKIKYEHIMESIAEENKGWNGLLLLVLFAGVVTYFSSILNAWIMKQGAKNAPVKQEIEVGYSMREAKKQQDGQALPAIDPQMIGRIMKFVLPLIMVIFTFISTAALAIYIITNSIIMTGVTVGLNYLAEWIIKLQQKRKKDESDIDENIINPHAKYFKKKKS